MDNTPFPRQSDLTGSSSTSGMSPGMDSGGMGQSGLGSTSTTTGTNMGSGSMGTNMGTNMGGSGTGDQAKQAVERASTTAHETVDRLASKASRFAGQLDEKNRKLTDAPMRAWETSRTQVQDHPMQAIAASLVIGFLLGRLTGSRSRYDDY